MGKAHVQVTSEKSGPRGRYRAPSVICLYPLQAEKGRDREIITMITSPDSSRVGFPKAGRMFVGPEFPRRVG